jgi:type IV pilus assembly protein PilA
MLNRNGFTMIELLAIVLVLSVILLVALPKFVSSVDETKEREREKVYALVINAGKSYSSINNISVGEHILIATLCEEKYIECPIINPVTGDEMEGYVYSSIDSQTNSMIYDYAE